MNRKTKRLTHARRRLSTKNVVERAIEASKRNKKSTWDAMAQMPIRHSKELSVKVDE